jgi:hypothetical protein
LFGIVDHVWCSVVFAIVVNVTGQSTSEFANGEGQRVYDLLDGLGCIGNSNCTDLGDFMPATACDYKPEFLKCNDTGLLTYLYVDLSGVRDSLLIAAALSGHRSELSGQHLTGTFVSNLNTFNALTWLYALFCCFQF